MKPFSSLFMLAFTALTLVSAPLHAVTDDDHPRPEQYSSTDAYMKALLAWESRPASADSKAASTTHPIPVPEGIDPTSETAPPPLAINGPEDLDTAVELAKGITHPNYTAPIRYHRSTHISFPLTSIDGQDMSEASIPNALQIRKPVDEKDKDKSVEVIEQQMSQDSLGKINDSSKGSVPDAYAGISLGPRNGPSHIIVESNN